MGCHWKHIPFFPWPSAAGLHRGRFYTFSHTHSKTPPCSLLCLGFLLICWLLKIVVCAFKRRWLLLFFYTVLLHSSIFCHCTLMYPLHQNMNENLKSISSSLWCHREVLCKSIFFCNAFCWRRVWWRRDAFCRGRLAVLHVERLRTSRLKIKSISIQLELLKPKGKHKHRLHPTGQLTELHPCDSPSKRYWSQTECLHSWLLRQES